MNIVFTDTDMGNITTLLSRSRALINVINNALMNGQCMCMYVCDLIQRLKH